MYEIFQLWPVNIRFLWREWERVFIGSEHLWWLIQQNMLWHIPTPSSPPPPHKTPSQNKLDLNGCPQTTCRTCCLLKWPIWCLSDRYCQRYKAKSLDHDIRSQWPPFSMRSLTVSDWTSIQSMMHKWIIFSVGGWQGMGARIGEIFFYKESGKWIFW